MPVTDVQIDDQQRTITWVAEYAADASRVWNAYLDPRQIERFWAPPSLSARFLRHDAYPGGVSRYELYADDDEVYRGYWMWESIVAPTTFTITDGSVDDDGVAQPDSASTMMRVTVTPNGTGARVTIVSTSDTEDSFTGLIESGTIDGMQRAMEQGDQLLMTLEPYATEFDTTVQRISPHQLRVSRLLQGPVAEVWETFVTPDDLSVWKSGHEGWSMPVCRFVAAPETEYVMEWRNELGGQGFGVMGEVVEVVPEHRLVMTEQFIGEDSPKTLHELTFTALNDLTLVTTVITYPSEIIHHDGPDSGVKIGFEETYDRLDRLLLARPDPVTTA